MMNKRSKYTNIKMVIAIMALVLSSDQLVSQVDSMPTYRLYASQKYRELVGTNADLQAAMEDEIRNIEIPQQTNRWYFNLKFHILESSGIINDAVVNKQVEILNQAFNTIDSKRFVDNENLQTFYAMSAVSAFTFCIDESVIYRSTDSKFEVNVGLKDALYKLSPPRTENHAIHIYVVDAQGSWAGMATSLHLRDGFESIVIDKKYFGIHGENEHNKLTM